MNKADYARYIASPDWKQRREPLLEAHGYKCWLCGIPRRMAKILDGVDMNLHHTPEGYAHIGEERPEDVEARCLRCHEHEEFRNGVQRTWRPDMEWAAIFWMNVLPCGWPKNEATLASMAQPFCERAVALDLNVAQMDAAMAEMARGESAVRWSGSLARFEKIAARMKAAVAA